MAFFVGEYEHAIDAKRRLAITMTLREMVDPETDGNNFILFLGPDKHLWLYPDLYYRRLVGQMKRSPLPSREQDRIALYFAMARLLKSDAQGRVVLPEKSMQRASISKAVTLVGANDHIEIWPSDEWDARVEQGLPDLGEALHDAADRLSRESDITG